MMPSAAMVLAAGLGRRMRPLTEHVPKPLLPLGRQSLLDHALDLLAAAGVQRVVVNAHWRAERLRAHLAARPPPPEVALRLESELLDTGGGVAAALRDGMLGAEPFFVMNGDSLLLDGPRPVLRRMAAALSAKVDAVILLHRTFQVQAEVGDGDFFLDSFGRPRRRGEREIAPYVYAGVTLARPDLFEGMTAPRFSMNLVWDRALGAKRLGALVHDGLWFHLSRPEDLLEAEHALAAQITGTTT